MEVRTAPAWTWKLEVAGGNKDEVTNVQGPCVPTETVDPGWVITREIWEPGDTWRREKSCVVTHPDLDSLWTGWKVGLWERLGGGLEWQALTGGI